MWLVVGCVWRIAGGFWWVVFAERFCIAVFGEQFLMVICIGGG